MPQQTNLNFTKAQQDAIDFRGKDLLVSAGAGSGKTRVLIERIIRRLLEKDDPVSLSNILVVTFTRNATAELKSRVSKALSEALEREPENRRLYEELLYLGSAEISTIDAFLLRIVRENFDKLNIPRMFRIISLEEEAPIADRVMQEVLEKFYRKEGSSSYGDELFSLLQKNKFADAMDSLLNHKDESALRVKLGKFYKQFENYPEGIELLKESAEELRKEIGLPYFETRAGKALKAYSEEWVKQLPDMQFPKGKALQIQDFCERFSAALKVGYEKVKAELLTFPSDKKKFCGKLPQLYSSFEETIKTEKQRSADFAEQLYAFYAEYEIRLSEEKASRGVLTFSDITKLAYRLLKPSENGEPSPVARELSAHYKEIYIDEYQDVNRIQDEIFKILGEGKRFMVGDIKQSIYRFRGGDPRAFAGYRNAMPAYGTKEAEKASGNAIYMRDNFRCNEPIIGTVNLICGTLFQKAGGDWNYCPESDDLVFHKDRKSSLPEKAVQIRLFEKSEKSDDELTSESLFVANEIDRLLHDKSETKDDGTRISENDIVILVRTRTQAKPYQRALKQRGIKVDLQAENDDEIDPELIELLNLLSVIDNPYRDLPLLEALQSPYFGFSLLEVSQIRSKDKSHSLFDALECYEGDDALGTKIKKTLTFLADQRENATTLSVDRFLRKLYETPNFAWVSGSDIPIYLYNLARQYAANAYVGLFEFLRYVEKLLDNGKLPANGFCKEESAVRITTIHKSKGEEYPVLFVPSLCDGFSEKELQASLYFSEELGFSAKLYDKAALTARSTADCEVEKTILKQKSREESIRLLYVAMTRARERLYLTGTPTNAAYSQAEAITTGDRYHTLNVTNPLSWVLAFTNESEQNLYERNLSEGSSFEAIPEEPSGKDAQGEFSKDLPAVAPDTSEPLAIELSALHKLPSKVAASKISPDLFDRILAEDKDDAIEKRLELLVCATSFAGFLAKSREPSAADVGSATHAFLEFCDFSALKARSVKDEAERLVAMGFLPKESIALISFDLLEKFLKSPLFEMISSAKEVLREQQFARLVPMKELTRDPKLQADLEDEEVFVQGSIDLLLSTDKGWILVDYKTDHVRKGETLDAFRARMLAAHGNQLKTYAQAVEELFDALPARIYLYSLPLGRLIEFSMAELPA